MTPFRASKERPMEPPKKKDRFLTRENIYRAIWGLVGAAVVAIVGIIYLKLFGPQKFVIGSDRQSQNPIPVVTIPYAPEQGEEQEGPTSSIRIIGKNQYEVILVGEVSQPADSWFEIYFESESKRVRSQHSTSYFLI